MSRTKNRNIGKKRDIKIKIISNEPFIGPLPEKWLSPSSTLPNNESAMKIKGRVERVTEAEVKQTEQKEKPLEKITKFEEVPWSSKKPASTSIDAHREASSPSIMAKSNSELNGVEVLDKLRLEFHLQYQFQYFDYECLFIHIFTG